MGLEKIARNTGDWVAKPLKGVSLESLVTKAIDAPEVKGVLAVRPWSVAYLKQYLGEAATHNRLLRRLAGYLDTANRVTVPIDTALDYSNVVYGVGLAGRAIGTMLKLPGYLAYSAYYAGKTGDFLGALGNLAYEGISWLVPGSLPHLISRYTHQSEKRIVDEGVSKFLKADKAAQAREKSKIPKPRVITLPVAA